MHLAFPEIVYSNTNLYGGRFKWYNVNIIEETF